MPSDGIMRVRPSTRVLGAPGCLPRPGSADPTSRAERLRDLSDSRSHRRRSTVTGTRGADTARRLLRLVETLRLKRREGVGRGAGRPRSRERPPHPLWAPSRLAPLLGLERAQGQGQPRAGRGRWDAGLCAPGRRRRRCSPPSWAGENLRAGL